MKTALILEGGAMRNAHSAGALTALAENGYDNDYFDILLAVSAGACNGAYFISGQSHMFWDIWSNYLTLPEFINIKNLFTSRPVINLDYMAEHIMKGSHLIDMKRILSSKTKFYVTATNCKTGKAEYFINDKEETFYNVLKASSAIPVLYNRIISINGCEYIDGAVADPLPIKKAVEMGAEEIFVMLTRPEGYRKNRGMSDNIVGSMLKKFPNLKEAIVNRHIAYNESLEDIERYKNEVNIHIIRPRYDLGITRITTDPKKIKAVFRIGYYDALKVLKRKELSMMAV